MHSTEHSSTPRKTNESALAISDGPVPVAPRTQPPASPPGFTGAASPASAPATNPSTARVTSSTGSALAAAAPAATPPPRTAGEPQPNGAGEGDQQTSAQPHGRSLLRGLGIVGWDALEPVVLAALATEAPLLVIGPHGSAKTLLLARIAEALGLRHRHYNASLLNFDDLVGFPVPDHGRLVYLQTPSTIWEAESVFFDEVSRCRPDLQNKLFPIVHERVVQGVALEKLRYRWAAMNPPPREDGGQSDPYGYAGVEPLDIALADRFAFVITAPALGDLDARDRQTVLRNQAAQEPEAAASLITAVEETRARLEEVDRDLRESVAEYTQLVAEQLATAGHPLSTRRAVQLARNIVAVQAALESCGTPPAPEDAFYVAVRASLPDAAWGRPVSASKVLVAHRAAWEIAKQKSESPIRRVLSQRNPLRRIVSALRSDLPALETGQVVADSFASLSRPAQLVTSALLIPHLSRRTDLPAGTVEYIAGAYAQVARRDLLELSVAQKEWRKKVAVEQLPAIKTNTKRGRVLLNAAVALLEADVSFEVQMLETAYDAAKEAFSPLAVNGERLSRLPWRRAR